MKTSYLKNKNFILNLISIITIITIIFFYTRKEKKDISLVAAKDISELGFTKTHLKYAPKLSQAPIYDYHNLLCLMKRYRKIERDLYENFVLFINDTKNLKFLKKTLREFKIERSFFKKYLKQTNHYYSRSSIPIRKRNSLKYYIRVLEENIYQIKKMIKRFNLHTKIQTKIIN